MTAWPRLEIGNSSVTPWSSPLRTAREQGGVGNAADGIDVDGAVEGGGGRRRVLRAEGAVGPERGARHELALRVPKLAVDLHGPRRRTVDAAGDPAVGVDAQRHARRGPGRCLEPFEAAARR